MWFLKPKRTFESVLRELVEGLENGTIVLDRPAEPAEQSDPPIGAVQLSTSAPAAEPEPARRPT